MFSRNLYGTSMESDVTTDGEGETDNEDQHVERLVDIDRDRSGTVGILNAMVVLFKVIRKFFFKTIIKVLDGISGITKNRIFFPI